MGKRFELCPECGRRGFYEIRGYLGTLPAGTHRCRYCYHIELPGQIEKRPRSGENQGGPGPRARLSGLAERALAR